MNAIVLTFVNGEFAEGLSNASALPETVAFSHAAEIVLHFAKNSKMLVPIYLKFLNNGQTIANHITIIADENSEAVVLEEYAESMSATSGTDTKLEMNLRPHARMHYYKLQAEHAQSTHHAHVSIKQKTGSYSNIFLADCGSASANTSVRVHLSERNATCHLQGLYFLNHDHQTLNTKIHVEHTAENGTSSMVFKGILDNKSRALFHGKVHVYPNAFHSKTEQANHNLLLSPQAEVQTEPHLEIYADEVKCTHGATVGQLDPESLFYLRSRGIDKTQSLQLLTQAFATDVIDRIKDLSIRQWIHQRVMPYAEL